MDIAQEMSKMFDEEIRKTLFSSFEQCKTEKREDNLIDEIYKMRDKLTILLLCNINEEEKVKKKTESLDGFWEVIGVPYVEKGQIVHIKREDLKMVLLSANRKNRNNGKISPPNCGTI